MESREVTKKKKICVVTTNRADYGRMKPIMEAIQKSDDLELQVVAGTPFFFDHFLWYLRHGEPLSFWRSLPWHIRARSMAFFKKNIELQNKEQLMRLLVSDGFPVHARLPLFLEGGNLRVMAKTVGLALLGIPDIFAKLKPDIVLINGDRFEMLPIAFATVALNIPLAHIEGGDVSGTLDESTRHAITKLAHIHFPATKISGDRIRVMGEDPERIIVTGSPVIDTLAGLDLSLDNSIYSRYYIAGDRIDFTKPYLLVLQHPVTTRYEENKKEVEEIIAAVRDIPIQKIFLDPNIDGGSDGVSVALRRYRDESPVGVAFGKYFRPHDFYRIISNAAVLVGNSSSFIRESAYLGVPVVLVGNRQQGRERGVNVVEVPTRTAIIQEAVKRQIAHGRYKPDFRFGTGTSAEQIVYILSGLNLKNLSIQKTFFEL
jgi:UDP-hydrolysing UDP-N-acetyl-D-glucosamine 2-epimerase